MSTPLLMREIIATLTATGTTLYTRCGTRCYAAPVDAYNAESPGVVITLLAGTSGAHNPVWTARTEMWCYGGKTSNDWRIDQCSETYRVLSDRLRSLEMYSTANAVVMDCVEIQSESLTVDMDRNIPVSVSVWDWQIKPLT